MEITIMANVLDIIKTAEKHPPAAPLAELPDAPEYIDDERPDVHSASKTCGAWRIEDDGAGDWAARKLWEAEDEIARITAVHQAERARLLAQVALIDKRVAEITSGQARRAAFFRATLTEWLLRCRSGLLKGKARSRKLLYATIGFRQTPEKLEYEDEAKALAWARAQGAEEGLYRIEWKLEKDAVKRYARAHSIVPPGARWVGGDDEVQIRVEPPANLPAPPPTSAPLQLVKETP